MANQCKSKTAQRRGFLRSSAAVGAGLVLAPFTAGQIRDKTTDDLNVALLGAGMQGRTLMNVCLKMPGIRIKALCDIWKSYTQRRTSRILHAYRQEHNVYEDYSEMLTQEKDLDAVIIATPDFLHARQTIDCLNGGLDVYCERPMATTTEDAGRMVHTARRTGRLLQIGHQRRSNPRYIHCYEQLIKGGKILGNIEAANAFWHICTWKRGWPRSIPVVLLHTPHTPHNFPGLDITLSVDRRRGAGEGGADERLNW